VWYVQSSILLFADVESRYLKHACVSLAQGLCDERGCDKGRIRKALEVDPSPYFSLIPIFDFQVKAKDKPKMRNREILICQFHTGNEWFYISY
jgi:hypothetical protein